MSSSGSGPGTHTSVNTFAACSSPHAGFSPRVAVGQPTHEVYGHAPAAPASPMSRSLPHSRAAPGSGNYAVSPMVHEQRHSAASSNQTLLNTAAPMESLKMDNAQLAKQLKEERKQKEEERKQKERLIKEIDDLQHRLREQQQAVVRTGGSMNLCQAPGARDAYFDRDRLTMCMEDGLERALTPVVDLLHKYASGPYQAELTGFMEPLLQFIDPQQHHTPRARKHALRHSLLLQLDRWVWAPAADSKGISDNPIARAVATCPALGMRPVVVQQAFVYREMVKVDGIKAVSSLNKQLCAVQTGSRDTYQLWEPILKDTTLNAKLLVDAVSPMFGPQLLAREMGLPTLAADAEAVKELADPMYRLLFTAVMLRLCAEASHPAHLVEVTAGTSKWAHYLDPQADPGSYGGIDNEACQKVFPCVPRAGAGAVLAASPVGLVAGCYRPGIRLQQDLMLVCLNSTTSRVVDERYISFEQV